MQETGRPLSFIITKISALKTNKKPLQTDILHEHIIKNSKKKTLSNGIQQYIVKRSIQPKLQHHFHCALLVQQSHTLPHAGKGIASTSLWKWCQRICGQGFKPPQLMTQIILFCPHPHVFICIPVIATMLNTLYKL